VELTLKISVCMFWLLMWYVSSRHRGFITSRMWDAVCWEMPWSFPGASGERSCRACITWRSRRGSCLQVVDCELKTNRLCHITLGLNHNLLLWMRTGSWSLCLIWCMPDIYSVKLFNILWHWSITRNCNNAIDRLKRCHSTVWSWYNRHVICCDVVLWEVN